MTTLLAVKRACAEAFGVPLSAVTTRNDKWAGANKGHDATALLAMRAAMYLGHEITGYSFPRLGLLFDHRHHTTVMHHVRHLRIRAAYDQDVRRTVNEIRHRLETT